MGYTFRIVPLSGLIKIILILTPYSSHRKQVIRTCTNSMWLAHTNPLFYQFKTLKVHDLYTYQLGIYMFRYQHNLLPTGHQIISFKSNAESYTHSYDTRHATDLYVHPTNTLLAKNTIKSQGPILCNSLNSSIKNSPSLASLKYNLKKHILYIYNTNESSNEYVLTS